MMKKYFNPRTREGCDLLITMSSFGMLYFNPRTREGCDRMMESWKKSLLKFQSTHPRGVRRGVSLSNKLNLYISIHAPARGATCNKFEYARGNTVISIHAPARGATSIENIGKGRLAYFNPRTREGCDLMQIKLLLTTKQFQSTHPRGVRLIL